MFFFYELLLNNLIFLYKKSIDSYYFSNFAVLKIKYIKIKFRCYETI